MARKGELTDVKSLYFEGQSAFREGDFKRAKARLQKAAEMAFDRHLYDDLYQIYSTRTELHWRQGYQSAEKIRAKGLHNKDLREVESFANAVLNLLLSTPPTFRFTRCPPIDRLCLLLKLQDRRDEVSNILDELEKAGFGHLEEVVSWRAELAKVK